MKFHNRGLHKFQVLPTGTLQVIFPQYYYMFSLKTSHLRSLSQIHHMLPVNIKVLILPAIHYHPQGYHVLYPHKIHLIRLTMILHHRQVCFFLKIQECYVELHQQIGLVYCQP